MLKKVILSIALTAVALMGISGVAFASTNPHQAWQGACGRSFTSLSNAAQDLQYNGVLGTDLAAFGLHAMDGAQYQFTHQITVGEVAVSITVPDRGCYGHSGGMFNANTRTLEFHERVLVRIPPKLGTRACKGPGEGCVPGGTYTYHEVLPASCLNLVGGNVTIKVIVFVHRAHKVMRHKPVHHKPVHHKKRKKTHKHRKQTKLCNGKSIAINAQCVSQTNTNSTSQSGSTNGQGSPVINVNQTTQVNINQGQGQGQQQEQSGGGTTTTPTCQAGQGGTYPNCYSFSIAGGTQPQEYWPNSQSLTVCVTISGAYQDVKSVQFASDHYGAFLDGGLVTSPQPGSPSMWCDSTFSTGSEMPPNNTSFVQATASDGAGYSVQGTLPLTWQTSPTFL